MDDFSLLASVKKSETLIECTAILAQVQLGRHCADSPTDLFLDHIANKPANLQIPHFDGDFPSFS
jgi:hypothetical protein